MTVKKVIDKLQVLADNLELGLETPVLVPVNAFVQGGVQIHITELNPHDINYEPNLDQLVFSDKTSGIVIGFIPKYETNQTTKN